MFRAMVWKELWEVRDLLVGVAGTRLSDRCGDSFWAIPVHAEHRCTLCLRSILDLGFVDMRPRGDCSGVPTDLGRVDPWHLSVFVPPIGGTLLVDRDEAPGRRGGLFGVQHGLDSRLWPVGGRAGDARWPVRVVDDRSLLDRVVQHARSLPGRIPKRTSPGPLVRHPHAAAGRRWSGDDCRGGDCHSLPSVAWAEHSSRSGSLDDRHNSFCGADARLFLRVAWRRHGHESTIWTTAIFAAGGHSGDWRGAPFGRWPG